MGVALRRPRHRGPFLAALLVGGLALGSSSCDLSEDEDPPAATEPVSPSTSAPPRGSNLTVLVKPVDGRPTQVGQAAVDVTEETLQGGSIAVSDREDGSPAFRLPPYRADGPYPRAVLVVSNSGSQDELNPGTRAFTWGTDFLVVPQSSGRIEDNGDNLLQRGLYSEPALYKAELDLDRPACVVRGTDGIVTIRSAEAIVPGIWYHMECRREAAHVTVTTWPLSNPDDRSSRIGFGTTGDVTPADPTVPISIGGKVAQDGSIITSATDQMNGELANPFLDIDER